MSEGPEPAEGPAFDDLSWELDERSQARERALALLYEADTKGASPDAVLAGLAVDPDPLAVLLVRGVGERSADVDAVIRAHLTTGWSLERLAVIDRNVLRMATFELLARDDVPVAVVIDEAVELAKRFSTEESGRFVNGVLAAIARTLPTR